MATPGPGGYDRESEYFFKLNKEMIERKRAEQAAAEKAAPARRSTKFQCYMKCPKCGEDLKEIALQGIMVDRCTGCDGIYFDAGELDILLDAQQPAGFLQGLKSIWRKK